MDKGLNNIFEFEDFRVDAQKRLLFGADGEVCPLMPKAIDILLYLVERAGTVVEKDEIISAIWPDTIVEENNLTQNISILRRLLGEKHGENRFIATVPGRGYKFVALTRIVPASNGSAVTVEKNELTQSGAHRRYDVERHGNVLAVVDWSENDLELSEDTGLRPVPAKKTKRWLLVAVTALGVVIFGSLGLYRWRANTQAAPAPIKTIAVLPFKPLVSGSRNESLEFGMADTLISKLNSSGEIIARPPSSVRKFTGEDRDAVSIGRELGVDYVLEGNIQTSDDRIRVSVRLFSTEDGREVWGRPFNENFTDIFAAQDAIAERVATDLQPQLTANAKIRLAKHGTENPEAYTHYLIGRDHVSRGALPETEKGISHLKQAIELDPNYALAYAELANAYRTQALGGDLPAKEVLPKSKDAALKALAIDDTLAEAHVMAGYAAMWPDRNWEEAEKQAKRALELEPNNAAAIYLLENLYSFLGRHEEAIAFGKRARELDPLSLIYNSIEAQTLLYAGRVDEALDRAMKTRELNDNFWHVHFMLARIYNEKGMYRDAIAEADRAAQIAPEHSYALAVKGYALARSGAAIEARRIIDELYKRADNARHHTNIALVYTGLGDKEKALEHLEKGFEEQELQQELKSSPGWNDLRSEPRFIELMRKMQFE